MSRSGPISLFTFGSLTLPEVMKAVTGRIFPSQPAWVPGYRAMLLRGECFPGLADVDEGRAHGVVYHQVDSESLELLDRFEGDYYRRVRCFIMVSKDQAVQGWVYLMQRQYEELLTETPWDVETFRKSHFAQFIMMCQEFRDGSRESAANGPGNE